MRIHWNRPLAKMTNQKKIDYIFISNESEGPAPDTLGETLPISHHCLRQILDVFTPYSLKYSKKIEVVLYAKRKRI